MVIEVTGLITAVGVISKLLKDTLEIVRDKRAGIRARNESAQKQLTQDLEEIQENLKKVGEWALKAEDYLHIFENVLRLQLLISHAETFLKENFENCESWTSDDYKGNWRVLETMFLAIQRNMESPRVVEMGRAKWENLLDEVQIGYCFRNFTKHYTDAENNVRHKEARDLQRDLRDMTRDLQEVETALRNTIYESILKNLQKLGELK